MNAQCRICGNAHRNGLHVAREMMFGYRDEFEYLECSRCGCLQIVEVPEDLDKYYPEEYISFSRVTTRWSSKALRALRKRRTGYYLAGKKRRTNILSRLVGDVAFPVYFRAEGLGLDSRILDVGCGSGRFLNFLGAQGFSNLTGIDPFNVSDIFYDNGVRIYKGELSDLDGIFDFILLYHSFEHMPDPLAALKSLNEMLSADGLVSLCVPLVSSFAWREFGTNWVQLDAPRHLFLHSLRSIEHLVEEAGFKIESIEYDSTEFQFWGSEQYVLDIPLTDPRSYSSNPERSVFSEQAIDSFRQRAAELNAARQGDQACVFLRKLG
jgi:SAM-dependent methyltransferase